MNCKKCGVEFEPAKGLISFCSLKCRNSRSFSEEAKQKKSLAYRKNFESGVYDNFIQKYLKDETRKKLRGEKLKALYEKEPERKEFLKQLNTGKTHSVETKKKLSKKAIERFKEFPELHPNRICAGIKESYPEKMFKEYIQLLGLIERDYIQQFKIEKYFVDFFFPKLNLIVEIDGERWHKDVVKEKIREDKLVSLGFKIIRFKATEIIKKQKEEEIKTIIAAFA